MRPDNGRQDKFRKNKPVTWRYDSSLSPALDWDGQNGARELGEWLLARISDTAALPAPHRFPTPQQFLGGSGAVLATVPYGVRFGSGFQPFVRKRDVSHNDDEDLTREPEMVKAYRDTWEPGLHSCLTYMHDRLLRLGNG